MWAGWYRKHLWWGRYGDNYFCLLPWKVKICWVQGRFSPFCHILLFHLQLDVVLKPFSPKGQSFNVINTSATVTGDILGLSERLVICVSMTLLKTRKHSKTPLDCLVITHLLDQNLRLSWPMRHGVSSSIRASRWLNRQRQWFIRWLSLSFHAIILCIVMLNLARPHVVLSLIVSGSRLPVPPM